MTEALETMETKGQDLIMAGACLFFLLLSLGGIAAVFSSGEVAGVDELLMLIVCAGMALLFAWLTFSAVQAAGILGGHSAAGEKAPATGAAAHSPSSPSGAQGK